jgi:YbbR domain-containing protein
MPVPLLRQNLRLKIFSLLIAVTWWAVVHGEDQRLKDFVVPIDYVNLASNLEQSGHIVDTVTIRLRAPEAVLRNVTEDKLSVTVDLARSPMGEQHMPLAEKMMSVPAGTEVVRVSPSVIPVRIERRARREVPIVAEFSGSPPKGYERLGYAVTPPVATVEGPASEVAAVTRALTGTILLEGEVSDMEFVVRPIPEAPPGSRVRILVPTDPVLVQVRIGPAHVDLAPPAGGPATPARGVR